MATMTASSALVFAVIITLPLTARVPDISRENVTTQTHVGQPRSSVEPSPEASADRPPELSGSEVARLRTMPLLRANGPVAQAFPSGRGLDSPTAVRKVGNQLAKEAGIEKEMPEVWKNVSGRDSRPRLQDEESAGSNVDYPYGYVGYDDLAKKLASPAVDSHTQSLLDLAGLLVLAAPDAFADAHPFKFGAAPAQIISQAVAVNPGGCDAILTKAWTVGLGDVPSEETLKELFDEAQDACKDDPTPRWVYGHVLIENSIDSGIDDSFPRRRTAAIKFFENWATDEPGSPLAQAGLADAYVSQAELDHNDGLRPFTVRSYARRARDGYELALSAADVPEWIVGKAKAESILGLDAAVKTVEPIRQNLDLVVKGEVAAVYEAAHQFGAAADTAATTAKPIDRLALSYSRRWYGHGAWLGISGGIAHFLSDATWVGRGGGTVDWLGIIPAYRNFVAIEEPYSIWSPYRDITCRSATLQRNLIAQGKFKQSLRVNPSSCRDVEHVARFELRGATKTTQWDDIQNFWRYAGDLKRASRVASEWARLTGAPLAVQRQGEIEFLQGDFSAAERFLRRATDKKLVKKFNDQQPQQLWTEDLRLEAQTMLGLAREKAGQIRAARSTYQQTAATLRSQAEKHTIESPRSVCPCEAFAETRLAKLAESDDNEGAALRHFSRAALLSTDSGPGSGAEFNDYAAALLDADQSPGVALQYAKKAVEADPESPVFLEVLSQAQEAAGKTKQAATSRAEVAARDRTAFQTLNNSGVRAAQSGKLARAERDFESAVAARPRYAIAWFNSGVALRESWNPLDIFRSQASLAKAIRLDASLRTEPVDYIVDHSSYATGLDVSRPVDANWTFAKIARDPSLGLTWLLVVLAIFRLLFVLGRDTVVGSLTSRLLNRDWRSRRRWLPWLNRFDRLAPLPVIVFVGTAIATWPYVANGATPGAGGVLSALAMLALAGVFVAPRLARQTKLQGWTPSMIVGTLGTTVGYPLVPVPVDNDPGTPARSRWTGAILLAGIGIIALLLALVTGMPDVRMLGVGAFAMVSTALLPFKPFDGGYMNNKRAESLGALSLLAITTTLAMGWI